jgi:hypothetical protein
LLLKESHQEITGNPSEKKKAKLFMCDHILVPEQLHADINVAKIYSRSQ